MHISKIDNTIMQLLRTHETNDPFQIAKEKNIVVIEENLGEIYGYYNRYKRIRMIHINDSLSKEMKLLTCSHELGHGLLHPYENTPQLSKLSIMSELKIEKEANYFAANLIIDDSHRNLNLVSIYDILKFYGLPNHFERFLNPSLLF